MNIDSREIENGLQISCDICIAGAGAAGLSIALEFLNSNLDVVIIESGGFEYNEEIQNLNNSESVGRTFPQLATQRNRVFGGTTTVWSGWCTTLDQIDFKSKPWIENSGWPIKKQDLDPYYERAHKVCQLGVYNYDVDYWTQKDFRLKKLPFDSNKLESKIWQKSNTNFGQVYKEAILKSKNIKLYTYANLIDIEPSNAGQEITNFKVLTENKKQFNIGAKQYVLACGAIQNARCLLNANSHFSKGIGNEYDLVGRFFMEHPHIESSMILLDDATNLKLYCEYMKSEKFFSMITLAEEYQNKYKLANFSAAIIPYPIETNEQFKYSSNAKRYLISSRTEQTPNWSSRITLSAHKDYLGVNEVKVDWQLSEIDKKTVKMANILFGKEIARIRLGRLKLSDWLLEGESSWPEKEIAGGHHMGVTRMNSSAKHGVVDKNCKVHAINNLFIASSSVFPTAGIANPTLTIVALSIRIADELKRKLNDRN